MPINIPLDFTGVEARGRIRVPEGDYLAKVVKLEQKPAAKKQTPGLHVTFELLTGEGKGKRITDSHWLTKSSLWTLRNMLEAMGFQVPSGPMQLKEKMLKGRKVGLTIVDGEEYKGRINSEIADYIPAEVVGNLTSSKEAELPDDTDDGDELSAFEEDEPDETEDEDEGFGFEDDEEDDEPEEEEAEAEDEEEDEDLSFDEDDIKEAKGPQLIEYVKEAQEAGWDLGLGSKPKVAEVREALLALFEDEDEDEDDDDLEGFSLEDVE